MKNRILIIALLILSFTSAAKTQTQPNLPAEKIAKIETAITSFMARQSVPALSIAIVEDNQLRFQRGYGMADVENFVPAKASTVYRLGFARQSNLRRGDSIKCRSFALLSVHPSIDFTVQRFSFA